MRDINSIEKVLTKIREIWYKNPDLRLMQLLLNTNVNTNDNPFMYYVEDEHLIEMLDNMYNKENK